MMDVAEYLYQRYLICISDRAGFACAQERERHNLAISGKQYPNYLSSQNLYFRS